MPLELHYSGDDAWGRFRKFAVDNPLSGEELIDSDFAELTALSSDAKELLEVAVAYYGNIRTKKWLNLSLPALDGNTPDKCIRESNDLKMRNRLREHLMRLPA